MQILKCQGYSDDTFECAGKGAYADRDNCASGKPIFIRIQSGDDALIVRGQYAEGSSGGWTIGVSPVDPCAEDEKHIPTWPITIVRSERGYSPLMLIEAPDDATAFVVDEHGKPLDAS